MRPVALVICALLLSSCSSNTGAPAENTDEMCRDGIDNDGDGLNDCQDPDCVGKAKCAGTDASANSPWDGGTFITDGCGGAFYSASNVPPNVLIVLDRSGSMKETVGGQSKWTIAVNAIQGVLTTYGGKIYFGLAFYPGTDQKCTQGGQCGAGKVFVDVGPNTATQIQSMLSGASTCSTSNPSFRTPCGATLQTLTTYVGLKDPKRANYVLLLTDGKENCGGDPSASAAALFALNPSVKTFAVGFGSGVDANELNAVAKSGGTAKSGTPSYYQADDPAGLTAAFTAIAGSVLSCTYSLSGTPPDPNLLYVYFDKVEVKRDSTHANGWDYTKASNQVTFYGAACDELKSGTVKDLIIVFGCALKIE